MTPVFLSVESVVKIHQLQLDEFGGLGGIRDAGLLESAVAQAKASYGGEFLHEFPFETAAAYLFHTAAYPRRARMSQAACEDAPSPGR